MMILNDQPDQDLKRHRPEANLRSVSAAEKPGVLKNGLPVGAFCWGRNAGDLPSGYD